MQDLIWRFSQEKGLIAKSMIEIYLTIHQIIQILGQIFEEESEVGALKVFFEAYEKPGPESQRKIEEIVLQCFFENVARRIGFINAQGKMAYAYESLQHFEKCYLSPFSYLASKKPAFVTFTHVLQVKK